MQAFDDGERKDDRTVLMRLVRSAEDVGDVPDDGRFFSDVDADGFYAIVCHASYWFGLGTTRPSIGVVMLFSVVFVFTNIGNVTLLINYNIRSLEHLG